MSIPPRTLDGARVLVGVAGGIAAYKTAHLVRGLVGEGADVRVVPTASSLEFVGAATWEALSHHPVRTSVFEDVDEVAHVRLGQEADLLVIAPATADLVARLRMGRADDLLTASALVTRAPVVIAPAMHTEMWEHPATRENVALLRARGVTVLEPADGRLTGPDSGPGRLPEPEALLDAARAALSAPRDEHGAVRRDLEGRDLLISAGGTREQLDPVRFLANHSSGRQGWALAHAALVRGARVRLAAANVALETPPGAQRLDAGSAAELAELVAAHRGAVDALIMAAAVADFTAAERSRDKIKKDESAPESVPGIALRRTEDILRHSVLERSRTGAGVPAIVGFAAETGGADGDALSLARAKARRKGADLLVFNDVTAGVFGASENTVRILDRDGEYVAHATGSKTLVAHAVLDALAPLLPEVP
ncbi:bifunctional phosphopantothenoylcysteine decarboxylase/phosphopantothenate--cysteine ligase CoaBC [Brachybacterium saurashtrense]|uniref:Coenzyme A biosynthesis bifunctional protein CoaBC n=1 Tax=Brachybacterium saurashtrense TaxID=556288 RepID=A0A345YM62_9MICO|nr:bifunctional phosphopantothenoylcysteine decarboxylase/phosphopantothenate--cysteine ligase CoaBC [Brachybacterium saurashtrense]AXK45014.1 bifunctional phosphopantothenoylcysteine decarboxylase/phosphopantothenate--cysteine ligase CoaBC [Brachybacterium saurashtrense]RRR21698.1 bifunctional phosphopantothenoylcysteine decarboxylase/phosphopantothenate--cysteine ligase CoaBC [Brachybacterium saurashtrense]